MDMSEHTWWRLTSWAAVLPGPAQPSVYTGHTHTHKRVNVCSRFLPQLVSNVKFDINKCLHNDNNNLRNWRGQLGMAVREVRSPSTHYPPTHIATCLLYKACLQRLSSPFVFFVAFAMLIIILHN